MDAVADVNILLALADPKHRAHRKSSKWFSSLPLGTNLLICRVAQLGLIRLITSDTVMQGNALTLREAWSFFGEFISNPNVFQIDEPEGTQIEFMRCSLKFEKATKRVTDAYLAGFAIAGGFSFVTLDKGFKDFEQLDFTLL